MMMKRIYLPVFLGLSAMINLSVAAPHVHADGTVCNGDHGHAKPAKKPHVHADGTVCNGDHGEQSQSATAGDSLPDMLEIKVDAHARHALGMQFEQVGQTPHQAAKTLYGQMIIPPHAVTTYALPAAGRVDFFVQSAQQVKKGDLLYSLSSPLIVELASAADQARADLSRNAMELDTLLKRRAALEDIGTKNSELDTNIKFKQAEKLSLQTALKASVNKLNLFTAGGELKDGILYVHAHADGAIQSVDMSQGSWGEQGVPALVMNKKGVLEFTTTIYGTEDTNYAKAMLAINRNGTTTHLDGVLRITEHVDHDTNSRKLYFTPTKVSPDMHAGQLARLDLYSHAESEEGYLSIPNSALVKVGVNDVVFIKAKEDTFIMKKVLTLPARQGKTPVKGLIPGQTIISKGGYELKYILPTADKGKKAAGHFHADGHFCEGDH